MDGMVLFTNLGDHADAPFDIFDKEESVACKTRLLVADKQVDIFVLKPTTAAEGFISRNMPVLSALLIFNLLLPSFLLYLSYSRKVREQEFELAVKNAQLTALRGQLNAHFLFNVMESIRMHSLIKKETETAYMVECLALLLRQYVDWSGDTISVEKELELVKSYLELQKYRFGEHLSYVIEADEPSKRFVIPRLFIVTFVESACIHGIEPNPGKGHIFVRTYISDENKQLIMEIDDSGVGMSEELAKDILADMRGGSIADVKRKKRIGIVTACLRMRMLTNYKAGFELESEKGVGSFVRVTVPAEMVNNA
jgi:two-component system sensor histidine kinase YesM